MMKRAEMEAHLKSGGRLGFFCDDAFCEAWLAEDGVHLAILPKDGEEMEFVGDLDKLYEMQIDLELSLFPTADRRQ
ncbi:hypothetical protein H1164_03875 [Thermoactinomyces daqus]|uniref:Uncharacterized protein n=1 Tax=Thermoactinomyces daqus TaxID=1329516 RepID=A0A7W2AHC8_9BACL|nr:hypothetical protein [Thermoactinomyces daqus]MBA4542040.1 hypothetical protein [Thermoactinomyces daqus]